MSEFLNNEITFLPGVGPKRAELLDKGLNIKSFQDLLYYFPYRHVDRTRFYLIRELNENLPFIQVKGKILSYSKEGPPRGRSRLSADFSDGTGTIKLLWFQGHKWIPENFPPGVPLIIFGKPSLFKGSINIIHPELDPLSDEKKITGKLQPVYSVPEKLKNQYITSKTLSKLVHTLLEKLDGSIQETLPGWLLTKTGLIPLREALLNIHFPENPEILRKASYRLKFEELFYIQLNILCLKSGREHKFKGFTFDRVGKYLNDFYHKALPFELTGAQKRVIKEIRKDMGSGKQMNRLLQGDVGSGKTLVALMSMLIALDNGFQACLMAPTEILANQHFKTIREFTAILGIEVGLLTGSTKKAERTLLHENLKNENLKILIGTHALIEDTVQFGNLGLVVIDEQHRFGVAQRARLWKKSDYLPHVLVMTATPIPRTLAMTLYGDLDVSVIDELPPGRKPIKTLWLNDKKRLRLHGFIKEQIQQGRQVYIVYPLIKGSEKMDYKDLEDGYESIVRAFPPPETQVGVVHGRMKAVEKDISMKHFKNRVTQIMIATTVIEVGVDVPNASVMVIESAERFGLSQLHQLRGRVGRGAEQSYCVLMTGYKLSDEAKTRMRIMTETNDGFEIAEADLKLRGPGDIEGTQQSGIPFDLKIAHLGKDGQILQYARNVALRILDHDPDLEKDANAVLARELRKRFTKNIDWSNIS